MIPTQRPEPWRRWLVLPLCLLMASWSACSKSVEDQLAEARLQQEVGSYRESIATLQSILNEEPDQAEANLLLGTAQLQTGQPALAIWPLEVAGRSPEFADQADLALASAYLRLEQFDSALAAVDRVLARDPEDPQVRQGAITIRAGVHLASKDWDAALEDVDRLLATDAENPDALTLMAQAFMGSERFDEAEATLRRIWENPSLGATPAAGRAGIALAKLVAYERDDLPGAEKILDELMTRFPQDNTILGFVTDFLRYNHRPEFAEKLLREALERDPGDLNIRGKLATHLTQEGKKQEAEQLLVEATELFDSPSAWLTLSDFYRAEDRPKDALAAMERTLELVPTPSDLLRFRHADVLADAGDLEGAAAVAADIEGDTYRKVILGRLAYLRGDYAEALGDFDAGLKEWPNNAGARYLAAHSAIALGDLDRGLSELRESMRVGMNETDAGSELGLLYLQLGRPATALKLASIMLNDEDFRNGPRAGNALVVLGRAQWATGNKDEAREVAGRLAAVPGFAQTAVLEGARFEAADHGPAAGARFIEKSALDLTDPENETALRQACDDLVQASQGAKAVQLAEAAVKAHPDEASFHDAFGRVLASVGRSEEAATHFERALELDPENAPALEGQASLRQAAGDAQGARELLDRAAELDPKNASYPYRAAQIELAAGRIPAAEERLREALRREPAHAHAANDLAWILAERGESLDQALALATRASEVDGSATVYDTLGWVHYRRGEPADAVSAFERAHSLDPASPSIAYRLALALVETGERDRAAELFHAALAAGAFPEAEAARTELARLEPGAS